MVVPAHITAGLQRTYRLSTVVFVFAHWFPLTVLVEFAAEKGFDRLDYWPGSAPTDGDRFWDTFEKLIFDFIAEGSEQN